jgi:lysyl-tRNA synthetase class 2
MGLSPRRGYGDRVTTLEVRTGSKPLRRRFRSRFHIPPDRAARLLGLLVGIAGLVDLVSAFTPGLRARLHLVHEVFAPELTHLAAGATALVGLGLMLVGRGLARRRRLGYLVAIGLLTAATLTDVVKGLDLEEAFFMVVVGLLLYRARRLFDEPTDRTRWRTLAWVVPVSVLGVFAYGVGGLYVRRSQVHPRLTFPGALQEVASRIVGLPGKLDIDGFGHWFPASITVVGFIILLTILGVALAPVAERAVAHHGDRERVRALLERPDGDTLDPFALRHDKRYVFSSDGRAAVAYRYVNGVGLIGGEPLGEPSEFASAFHRFVDLCNAKGWRPAVLGARGDRLALYESAGMRSRYLGDEAVIDVRSFSLDGRSMRPVRQAANRTRNAGITVEISREGDLDPTLMRALVGISDRARAGAPERGFSMALDALLSGRDRDCIVAVARDGSGAPIAFQRYVPCRAGLGLSLDAMRRDAVGPNGVNERLIVETIDWARMHGIEEVSLNFAAFKGLIEEGADLGPLQSAQAWVIRRLNPYFQIQSLYTFNAKFLPRWVPRYLVYRNAGDLGPVAVAALSAEAFLPFDRGTRACTEGPLPQRCDAEAPTEQAPVAVGSASTGV